MSFWRWTLVVALLVLVRPVKPVDVQNALQQLLGVPSGDRGSSLTPPLPSYMMELYERYKSGDMLGTKQGNTVRSILAVKDNKMAHRLLFNLSGIHQQERILTAELHLYQFPKRRAIRDRVRLFTMDETHRHHRLESVESHANINGWSVYNVTDGVIQMTTSNSSSHQLLFGVRSVSGSKKRKLKTRKTLSKSGSVPFLIVFSQDKNSLQSDTSIPNNGMPELTTRRLSRRVRSLMDNRVIENDFGLQNNEFPQTRPFNPNHVSVSNNNPSILLPRGRAKSRPTRRPPFGKDEKNEEKHQYPNKSQNDANKFDFCQRKKLVVDFAQIGWSKWIIFPKTFEAHYCAGACPFPLTKNVNPSNHATIQSLVHALGVSDDIPAPCCVPSTMSSMSLLYLDQDGDVVLKNYPQMTVESCACR